MPTAGPSARRAGTTGTRARSAGGYFPADDLEEGEDADERLCRRCAARRGSRLIHPYSYKPEPIFHRTEGEEANALALGIELEMDGDSPERAARGILALAGSDYLYFKRDSSLEDGAELVTHPVSPTVLLSPEGKELWRSICRTAEAAGMRSHDTRIDPVHQGQLLTAVPPRPLG